MQAEEAQHLTPLEKKSAYICQNYGRRVISVEEAQIIRRLREIPTEHFRW